MGVQVIKMGFISWFGKKFVNPKWRVGWVFRNFKAFNLAMLAKQAWQILVRENSLLHKIYKAKCFPYESFFKAKLGSRPFFTWRDVRCWV